MLIEDSADQLSCIRSLLKNFWKIFEKLLWVSVKSKTWYGVFHSISCTAVGFCGHYTWKNYLLQTLSTAADQIFCFFDLCCVQKTNEWQQLKETSGGPWLNPPLQEQVIQCFIHSSYEYVQGWRLCNHSGLLHQYLTALILVRLSKYLMGIPYAAACVVTSHPFTEQLY